jgi:hypothetical protein
MMMPLRFVCRVITRIAVLATLAAGPRPASAQNDWQAPDPYFGVFQHRDAGTPEAERRYRQEIAPQQPQRLHDHRRAYAHPAPRPRWIKHRGRGGR